MSATKHRLRSTILVVLLFAGGVLATIEDLTHWWIAAIFGAAAVWYLFPNIEMRLHESVIRKEAERSERRKHSDLVRRALSESSVTVSPEGLRILYEHEQRSFTWQDILEVGLVWAENPWGDPQFGRYNDVHWYLKLSDSRIYRIEDSDVNRYILQPAFHKHLPGYSFSADGFDKTFAETEGRHLCWNRNA